MALNTGMRLGELLSLTGADVELSQRRVTKNGWLRRLLADNALLEMLEAFQEENGKGEYVFPSPRNGSRRSPGRTGFEKAVRRAGIGKLSFHDLRHRFATRLVAARVDIVTVKELLGHQDWSEPLE